MNKSTKVPAWSEAQLTAIEEKFLEVGKLNNDHIKEMINDPDTVFKNKTVNMLRSKVVNSGYYQAAEKVAVGSGGVKVTRKIEHVNAIETLVSLNKGALASFEKASKPQLEALANALIRMSEQVNADLPKDEPSK